jgi:MFS family permease
MEPFNKSDVRNALWDGVFAHMFATLTGGVFLTGFALHLGMREFEIGLLASMPFIVTIFQLPISFFISKNGMRKELASIAALLARLSWIPVFIYAFFPSSFFARTQIVLGLIFLSYAFASISYVAWLSWMSDLIPDGVRGRFFGTRNMLCGAAGMGIMIFFGIVLDRFKAQSLTTPQMGFAITFVSAIVFGIISLKFLKNISEPSTAHQISKNGSFLQLTYRPFKELNFRIFLIYSMLWGFSVHFASPFFTLYFLRDLRFSFGFVAILGMLSTLADLIGMQLWGRVSDRVKNKAVIQVASWIAIFIPLAWITVKPQSLILPIILHIFAGGFWAGINLCTNNLLLRISHQDNKTFFLSIFHIAAGLGAATGPILGGLFINSIAPFDLQVFHWKVLPIQVIFAISTLLRLLSFQILKYVHEPEENSIADIVRIIRSVRGLNMSAGFNSLLHPFVAVEKEKHE